MIVFSSNPGSFSSFTSLSRSNHTTQNKVQLQLSLTLADDLHDLLLLKGEPVAVQEAAGQLLAVPEPPLELSREVMCTLVQDDGRFCWTEEGTISLQDGQEPDPDLTDVSFVIIDLETTGTRPGKDKITEVGAVRLRGLREEATFHSLINPFRRIPPRIVELTGITQTMVARAPRVEDVLPELLDFLQGAVLVGHNIAFDLGFLNHELTRLCGKRLGRGSIDTLPLSRRLTSGLPNHRLSTVAEALGAPETPAHRALADARATAYVLSTLAGRLQEKRITRLHQLRTFLDPTHRRDGDKLALTRDMPQKPGNYMFLDSDGEVLYVGRAEKLRNRVRSYFLNGTQNSRRVGKILRHLHSIDWAERSSPLEAVVKEQELIYAHRPSGNIYGRRPERYQFLRAAGNGGGLRLYATDRYRPESATPEDSTLSPQSLAMGPFRGRKRVKSALDLLHRCYPLRQCRPGKERSDCLYGQTRSCLQPCTGDPGTVEGHDRMVTALMHWLAGGDGDGGEASILPEDPAERAEKLMGRLSGERRYEQAEEVKKGREDLLKIRRSHRCVREALALDFAAFWPQCDGGDPRVRMDLVRRGELLGTATLSPATVTLEVNRMFQHTFNSGAETDGGSNERYSPVAVPQEKLDTLLAVRRWRLDHPQVTTVSPPDEGSTSGSREEGTLRRWHKDVLRTAHTLLHSV